MRDLTSIENIDVFNASISDSAIINIESMWIESNWDEKEFIKSHLRKGLMIINTFSLVCQVFKA
jgi:hypothetical protein